MRKATSIRLIFLFGALACCIAYGGGYYQSIQQEKENAEKMSLDEEISKENIMDATESAAIISPYEFVLGEEDEYVIVYYADAETIYSTTDIKIKNLPERLQAEILEGKKISTEKELYNFLENYSS